MTEQGASASFARVGVLADPQLAAQVREEFAEWLRNHFQLDPEKSSDVLLAVYEALANAAEFAYVGAAEPGPMHMHAAFDPGDGSLRVTVTDEGVWRTKDESMVDSARGRGLPLIHALSDRADIDTTPTGTCVRLEWDHITPNHSSELR
ncbi:ATP-binding protein [Arthrobacter sp. SLBN-53]|uniref:ATP-binding protein n=1 Tax=Arthrobacter sp. SLBN-53 TaxID=2768412 RepID=UPI0011511D32|nr:ATP-binding protein [Arthrobacter sp. SLBN-53]TQK28784.1 anti-sigma regulatory factor (Ser/Thr protein kinase) [Arthrobacter sp. SLBN-53]